MRTIIFSVIFVILWPINPQNYTFFFSRKDLSGNVSYSCTNIENEKRKIQAKYNQLTSDFVEVTSSQSDAPNLIKN